MEKETSLLPKQMPKSYQSKSALLCCTTQVKGHRGSGKEKFT